MKDIDMAPFYPGQKVVALVDSNYGFFRKGQLFTVQEIKRSICKCNRWDINIGIKYDGPMWCSACKEIFFHGYGDGFAWLAYFLFAPVESVVMQEVSFKQLTKEFPVPANQASYSAAYFLSIN